MAVYRVQRTRDYTVMSNYHLKDKGLTLKSKGLLSMILSLPEEWNYTTRGLASICKEGVDAIGSALKELETAGYIVRRQLRGANGRITDTEYIIYEQPQPKKLDMLPSDVVSPDTENPDMVKPDTEKPAELNIEKSNTEKSITYGSSTDSIPFRETAAARPPERKGRDAMSVTEIENYRELILENIEYDCLKQRYPLYLDDLNEIVELLVETVCAKRKTTRISGADFPHEIVRSRFLKLDSSHIEFVMDCLQKNTTQVRNMKQYLLAVLFNAPTTMNNHYFEKLETGYMDVIRGSIENRADDVCRAKKELRTTPVYPHSAAYAKEHGEMEQYRASNNVNLQCKEAIEAAVREHFDGMYLSHDAAKGVIETFGMERVALVLANTVQLQDWDGRYSRRNKEWAKTIPNENPETVRCGYVLNSHPAVLDGFIDLVREEQQRSRTQGEKLQPSRPSVRDKLKQELPAHKPAAPKKREPER